MLRLGKAPIGFNNLAFQYRRGLPGRGEIGEFRQHAGEGFTHVIAMDNHVDCAVLKQKLAALAQRVFA